LLAYPTVSLSRLASVWPELGAIPNALVDRLENDASYAVYLGRQAADIAAFRRDEAVVLRDDLDFAGLDGLSNEIRTKLALVRPRTLGQAARIEGITPAAVTLLAAHARKETRRPPTPVA
jgi:tRNA uridine 5-carboxymethylaminomethyl modification enzyme